MIVTCVHFHCPQELYENPGPIQLSELCAQEGCLNAVA